MGAFDVPHPLIPDLIAQHGRWLAGKPALLCGERRSSGREFDRATNQVAQRPAGAKGSAPGVAPRRADAQQHRDGRGAVRRRQGRRLASCRSTCRSPTRRGRDDRATAGPPPSSASGAQCARIDALAAAGRLRVLVAAARRRATGSAGWQRVHGLARPRSRPTAPAAVTAPTTSATSSTARARPGCRRASFTATPAGCTGRRTSGSRCGTTAAPSRSARSACTRTSCWAAMLATLLVGGTLVVMPAYSSQAAASTSSSVTA